VTAIGRNSSPENAGNEGLPHEHEKQNQRDRDDWRGLISLSAFPWSHRRAEISGLLPPVKKPAVRRYFLPLTKSILLYVEPHGCRGGQHDRKHAIAVLAEITDRTGVRMKVPV